MLYLYKKTTLFFCLALSVTTSISSMNYYKYLNQSTSDLLKNKCSLCKNESFFTELFSADPIKKECDFLEKKLEIIDTTGGARVSSGTSYWTGILNYSEFAAQEHRAQENKQAIDIILADSPAEIRQQEYNKLCAFAAQLAQHYDARIAAKEAHKQKILQELAEEEQKRKDNPDTIAPHTHAQYPHINNMLESSQIKHACVNDKKSWRVARFCNCIEADYKKVAETGHLKLGFFSMTNFEDKNKEHETAISVILPHESEENKFTELIKLNAYASQLQKEYMTQYDLQQERKREENWQKYLMKQEEKKMQEQKNLDDKKTK